MTDHTHRYDDIIDLPHHVSKRHPPMSREQRAAQFAPFAALVGYDASVAEEARHTERRIELDENIRAELDVRLHDALEQNLRVQIDYFVADMRKDGGEYRSAAGSIAKIEEHEGVIVLEGGERIAAADVVDVRHEGAMDEGIA